jgi:hypothetical protein
VNLFHDGANSFSDRSDTGDARKGVLGTSMCGESRYGCNDISTVKFEMLLMN